MLDRRELTGYVKKLVTQWDKDIDDLERKLNNAGDKASEKYTKKLKELKEHRNTIKEKHDSIEEVSEESLDAFKEQIEESKGLFSKAIKEIKKTWNV